MGLLDFLNRNSGAFNVLFSLVVAAATVFYAVLTRRLVNETARMRIAQTEPMVSVHIEPHHAYLDTTMLVVENVGPGPAYDLRFSATPDFEMDPGDHLSEVGLFRYGMRYLAPRQRVSLVLTTINEDALLEIEKPESRFRFDVRVSYRGVLGSPREEVYPVDFRQFVRLSRQGTPPLQSIAENIEKLHTTVGHVASGHKRVRVDTYSAEDRERERQRVKEERGRNNGAGQEVHTSDQPTRSVPTVPQEPNGAA